VVTQQEISAEVAKLVAAAFAQVAKRLLPARLSNTNSNAAFIAAHLKDQNLAPTPENIYAAINALAFQLQWDVEPEKVKARRANERPAKLKSVEASNREFIDKMKASEAADAKAKRDAEFDRKTLSLIDGFVLVDKMGRATLGKSDSVKTSLRQYFSRNRENGGKASAEGVFKAVQTHINKLYQEQERANERV